MSTVHQNWWFTTLLIRQFKYCPPLSKSLKCDVLIVGGDTGLWRNGPPPTEKWPGKPNFKIHV